MKTVKESAKKWRKSATYRAAYDALEDEYALAGALIEARMKAGITQKEVARRMKTTQPMIARMEGGRQMPSSATLLRFAKATGTKLRISFV